MADTRDSRDSRDYDVVVIGAGLGGLLSGAQFLRRGQRVASRRAAGASRRPLHRQDVPWGAGQHGRGAYAALRHQWRAGRDVARAGRSPPHPRFRGIRLVPCARAPARLPLGAATGGGAGRRASSPSSCGWAERCCCAQPRPRSAPRPTATGWIAASTAQPRPNSTPTSSASATSRSASIWMMCSTRDRRDDEEYVPLWRAGHRGWWLRRADGRAGAARAWRVAADLRLQHDVIAIEQAEGAVSGVRVRDKQTGEETAAARADGHQQHRPRATRRLVAVPEARARAACGRRRARCRHAERIPLPGVSSG